MTHGVATRRSLVSKTLAMALMVMLVGAWLAPVAHAQVGIGDAVGDTSATIGGIGDAVGTIGGDTGGGSGTSSGVIGGVTDGLEGATSDSGSATGGGDPIGGVINTVDTTKDQVDETAGDTAGNIGQVAPGAGGVIGTVKETVGRTADGVTGTGGKKKAKGGRSTSGGHRSTSPSPIWTGNEILGGSYADALRADGMRVAAAKADDNGYAVTGPSATNESVITQIGRVAAEAVRQAAFPIALILMVAAFLMVQNRIDSKDPKLALAAVDPEHDLLSFT